MSCAATCGSRSDRTRVKSRAVWLVVSALALAGCVTAVRLAKRGPSFDHAAHLGRDLSCTDCHAGAADEAKAGMPKPSVCADCHDPKEDKPELASFVATYGRVHDQKRWPTSAVRGKTYGDVKFSHVVHVKGAVDCAQCHSGAKTGPVANPSGPLSMDDCMKCHDERGVKNDCATCHSVLGKDEKPANHEGAWLMHHGAVSRVPDPQSMRERCETCHSRADCDECHQRNAPKGHNETWRMATHGLAASMDRSRCMACHESDSCDRCHEVEPPRSHGGSFASPTSTHCLSCHVPVSAQGCGACHKGTPSHATATPKPSWHSSGMNCRQCHTAGGQVMPHVDNGMNCNTCHP